MSPTAEAAPGRVDARLLIHGRWIDAASRIEIRSPARTADVVGSVALASPEDVSAAVEAAAAAFPAWSALSIGERAAILDAAAAALAPDADERIRLLARENGQLLSEARGGVLGAARTLTYYAGVGRAYELVEELPAPNGRVVVEKQPIGPAALIVPWNAPTRLGFLGLAPILLAGNTVVVKAPSEAPLALIDALAAIHDLFPPGTINVVTVPGGTVGAQLVSHPAIRKVNFTGSTATGKEILRLAAGTVKRVSLELGGNDPAIVLDDADLDMAVPELVRGSFALSGQMCYDVKRIYVQSTRYPDFVTRFTAAVDELVVGDGLDPAASMGTLINAGQRDRIVRLLEAARRAGGRVDLVGSKLDETAWDGGTFHLPAVVTGIDERAELVSEEQFGPAIPIMPFDTVDEAIGRANQSAYGLASSIWSRDVDAAMTLARRIEAGSTFVNVHRAGASGDDMPFGGFKESGLGRGHGVVALDEQFELHMISSRRP